MRAELERYRVNDAIGNRGDVDMASVGLLYRFGRKAPAPPKNGRNSPTKPAAGPGGGCILDGRAKYFSAATESEARRAFESEDYFYNNPATFKSNATRIGVKSWQKRE